MRARKGAAEAEHERVGSNSTWLQVLFILSEDVLGDSKESAYLDTKLVRVHMT